MARVLRLPMKCEQWDHKLLVDSNTKRRVEQKVLCSTITGTGATSCCSYYLLLTRRSLEFCAGGPPAPMMIGGPRMSPLRRPARLLSWSSHV